MFDCLISWLKKALVCSTDDRMSHEIVRSVFREFDKEENNGNDRDVWRFQCEWTQFTHCTRKRWWGIQRNYDISLRIVDISPKFWKWSWGNRSKCKRCQLRTPNLDRKTAQHCKECKKQVWFQCSKLIFKNKCKSDYLGYISYKSHLICFLLFYMFLYILFSFTFQKHGSIEHSELSQFYSVNFFKM